MTDTVAYNDSIEARNGASVVMPSITSLYRVDLTIRDTASVSTSQITTYKQATLLVSGGASPNFSSLATLDFSAGGELHADGAGSVLALPALTSLQGATGYGDSYVNATNGGKVDLSAVTSDAGNRVQFTADGMASTIDLSGLTAMADTSAYNDSITARNGAQFLLGGGTIRLTRVDLSASSGGTVQGGTRAPPG